MKITQRGKRIPASKADWQILEAPSEESGKRPRSERRQRTGDRERAWGILEAPTGEYPAVQTDAEMGPSLPEDSTVHSVLDLALRIGEIQMASGAGAADVTATILNVASAFGLPTCEVDVIFTSITVTCHRGTDSAPVSAVRVVRSRGLDYSRLSSTEMLVRQINRGRIGLEEAHRELRRITNAPHPYPRWVATLAWGGMAAFIALLIGGNVITMGIALVVSSVIDRVGRALNRYSLPFFFQQVVGGMIAILSAMVVVKVMQLAHVSDAGTAPTLVTAAAITVLLSGLSTVTAVQDAITGYNVTAAGRTMEVVMMSAGLITGVAVGIKLGEAVYLQPTGLPGPYAADPLSLTLTTLSGAGASACFALASYSRIRSTLVAAAAGLIGAAAYGLIGPLTNSLLAASAIAATLVGFCGGLMARRLKVTPLVVAVSGITPLLPGLSTYRGLYLLAVDERAQVTPIMAAVGAGLALAAGVVLGEYLAQPVRTRLGRLERKISGPRLAGPLRASDRRLD